MGCFQSKDSFSLKYDLHENEMSKLGEGGYAIVYKCAERNLNTQYAVKVVNRKRLSQEEDQGILREVEIMKLLKHPNVVTCVDMYIQRSKYLIVMDLVLGGELFDRIVAKNTGMGSYTELEARDTMKVMFTALKYLHDQNIAHRDLKPENLLLTSKESDSSLKIADFGFATITHGDDLTEGLGTMGYVAPEILLGRSYGKAVDVWSMGVITYILIGGYPPFHESTEAKNNFNTTKGKYTFPSSHWGHVSSDLKELIKGMMTVNPKRRLTMDQCLSHPWMQEHDEKLKRASLEVNMKQFRLTNAKRKFRASIKAIIATKRMGSVLIRLKALQARDNKKNMEMEGGGGLKKVNNPVSQPY